MQLICWFIYLIVPDQTWHFQQNKQLKNSENPTISDWHEAIAHFFSLFIKH